MQVATDTGRAGGHIDPQDPTTQLGSGGHVLHVLEASLGGTRQYLDDLVQACADMPLRMSLAYASTRADTSFPATLQRMTDAGWATYCVPMVRLIRPGADLKSVMALRRLIRQVKPDLIHCHSSKAGGIGRMAAVGLSVPVMYSPHALASNLAIRYGMIERLLGPLTSRFVAISDSEREQIAGLRLAPKESIQVVYPVVDAERFAPRPQAQARRQLGFGRDAVILGVGRLSRQKDPLGFIETVARVRQVEPEVRAVWVGDGEERPRIERALRESGQAEAIQITGWKTDVRPYLAAADLFLSTSRFESFGYVVAEALAMERPTVASRVMGTVDVVQGEARRLLYPPRDYSQAAERSLLALRNPMIASRLARSGGCFVRNEFSRQAMSERLRKVYAVV